MFIISYQLLTSTEKSESIAASNLFRGEYFNNTKLSGTPVITIDKEKIDFNWSSGSPNSKVNSDNFSARWTGPIHLPAGTFEFTVTADDGIRLWVDGKLLIDKWKDQAPTTYAAKKVFTKNAYHSIKVEYYEKGGGAVAKLSVADTWDLNNVKAHINYLAGQIGPREAGTGNEHKAADYIKGQLTKYGYTIQEQSFNLPNGRMSYNIFTSKTRKTPNKKIILGAHCDSKSVSPGANDNASGTGLLLELAKYYRLREPNQTLTFVFFGSEEMVGTNPADHHFGSRIKSIKPPA